MNMREKAYEDIKIRNANLQEANLNLQMTVEQLQAERQNILMATTKQVIETVANDVLI